MIPSRSFLFVALVAGLSVAAAEARAQGFFERLFGLPSRPFNPPPAPVPQYPAPVERVPGPADHGGAPIRREPAAPPAPKPVMLKPPTEDSIIAKDLKLNGTSGILRIERAGGEYRAQLTLQGAKISQPTEACSVKLNDGGALTLAGGGKPEGLPRYEVPNPACPIVFDVLDGAVLVREPGQACSFEPADCRVEPLGMWGPEPGQLIPKAREIEQARGAADRAVRENYKALTHKASPQQVRSVVAEQAAFSSEREQVCRSYAREGAHGFCNARFSEGRAVMLASRLGLSAPTAQAEARRPRRPRTVSSPEAVPPEPE